MKLTKSPLVNSAFFSTTIIVMAGALSTSCVGRNIHSKVPNELIEPMEDRPLVRQWTLATRPSVRKDYADNLDDAGVRGHEFSTSILFENTLIVGTRSAGLVSVYPSDNQQRWVLPVKGGVLSPLGTEGNRVFFGGGDGYFYAVDGETGRVLWRYEVRTPYISKPIVVSSKIFFTTSDDSVVALDVESGKFIWSYRRKSPPQSTVLGASMPLVDKDEVIAGLSDGFLVGLALKDGQLVWEKKLHQAQKFTDVDAHPVLEAGTLYVPSYDGALYALKRDGGATIWKFDGGASKTPVLDESLVYLPSSDGNVYALQKSNGKALWKFELDQGVPTDLVLTDKYVIVGSSFQYLYALDRASGRAVYRFNCGWDSGFYGTPLYYPEKSMLFALSSGGNLYSFRVKK